MIYSLMEAPALPSCYLEIPALPFSQGTGSVTKPTWVCSSNVQQSQSPDIRLRLSRAFTARHKARRTGNSGSKDLILQRVLRRGFFKATFAVTVAAHRLSSDWFVVTLHAGVSGILIINLLAPTSLESTWLWSVCCQHPPTGWGS